MTRRDRARLYTDASVREGAGGWAAWLIRADGSQRRMSGEIPGEIESLEAEIIGIVGGLKMLLVPSRVDLFIDNQAISDELKLHSTLWLNNVRPEVIRSLEKALKFHIHVAPHWIRGHKSGHKSGNLSIYNQWCDRQARARSLIVLERRMREGNKT